MAKKTEKVENKPGVKNLKIKPLGDRVLIKVIKVEDKTTTFGIIIPDTVSDDHGAKKGEVIAVGPGRLDEGELIPVSVSVGDKVLFQWGDEIKIEGEEYHVVSESNILAVIK